MKLQIILAGIGGQGILFSSKIFSELGLKLGLGVIGSETHGMSQRGGSVIAHLKLGPFQSPMIRSGTADYLYSFEKNETYRTLHFLKEGGVCFADLVSANQLDKKILNHLKEKEIDFHAFDATGAAFKIGSIVSANIVLIGYSIGTGFVPFKYKDVKDVLEKASKKKGLEVNLKALQIGYEEGKSSKRETSKGKSFLIQADN
jgi:indolepyruvate ferredoxin oxidoreductase beta subunit